MYGTDIADQLRASNFIGLILLRSGSPDCPKCVTSLGLGHIDGFLDKAGSNKQLADTIRNEYTKKSVQEREVRLPDNYTLMESSQSQPVIFRTQEQLRGRKILAIDDSEVKSETVWGSSVRPYTKPMIP